MKRLGILAGVFLVLLLVLVVQRWQRSKIVVAGPAETVKLDPETVTRVKIQNKDGTTELERTGSEWKLVQPIQYPANTDLVKGMLKVVEELKLEDVISSNPANRATYQVDSTGTAVEVWTGDKQALSLVVGKSTQDWTHTFVRRADGDEVYRAGGVLTYQFARKPDEWRDKAILKLEPRDIQRVVLSWPKEKEEVALARADSLHWNVVEGARTAPADSATAERLAGAVAKLSTVQFATQEESAGRDFAQADFRLAVHTTSTTRGVSFLDIGDGRMLAKSDSEPTVFSLYQSNLGTIMKKGEELRTGKAPEPAAAAKSPKPKRT